MTAKNSELMLDVGQANELKLAFRREGWSNQDIKALTERKGFLAEVLGVLEGRSQILVIDPQRISVDYSMSLKEMAEAGCYDWVSPEISANYFPINKGKEVNLEVKLFHFGRATYFQEVVKSIMDAGWFPAKIEHLLAWGAKNPEEQRKYSITALGSVVIVNVDHCIQSLWENSQQDRMLTISSRDGGWDFEHRFLAYRVVS